MPITGIEIKNQMASALDAEGSDHYKDTTDYIPAINSAIDDLLTLVDLKLGNNKFSEEALRELAKVMIFKTSMYSRVNIPDNIRTIRSVIPNVTIVGTTAIAAPTLPEQSQHLTDVAMTHAPSSSECKRMSAEQFQRMKNMYKRSSSFTSDMVSYFYTQMEDYSASGFTPVIVYTWPVFFENNGLEDAATVEVTYNGITESIALSSPTGTDDIKIALDDFFNDPGGLNLGDEFLYTAHNPVWVISNSGTVYGNLVFKATGGRIIKTITPTATVGESAYSLDTPREIEIFPAILRGIVAIKGIKNPQKLTTTINQYLPFPVSVKDLLVNLALFWTSFKQGDGTNINGVSREMIIKTIQKW